MASTRLSLVTLRCKDIEASKQFFEAIGLSVTEKEHKDGTKHYSCKAGNQLVELYPRRRLAAAEIRLGFVVLQVDTALENLRKLGIEAVRTLGRPMVRYAVVKDPDGHTIELHS